MIKKLLFIALGELSTGELIIAREFAKNLPQENYQIHFLVSDLTKGVLGSRYRWKVTSLSPKDSWKKNRERILSLIKEEHVHCALLFDVYTFEYAEKWTGVSLKDLQRLDLCLGSLDEYDYQSGDFKIDYYGLIVKKLPNLLRDLDFILKNCPLNMPKKESTEENLHYYKVLESQKPSEDRLQKKRKEYTREGEKLVFFTLSKWELDNAYTFINHKLFIQSLLDCLYQYLADTGLPIHLVHVGASLWEKPKNEIGRVRYTHFSSLEVEDFEELLAAADLYITYNLVSITLTKAVEFGIPAVVLNNDKILDFQKLERALETKPRWYREMAKKIRIVYPFDASSFGWHYFLREIKKGNIYMKTFTRLPLFKYKLVVESLKNLLENGQTENCKKAIRDYQETKNKIPSPSQVMERVFQEQKREEGL